MGVRDLRCLCLLLLSTTLSAADRPAEKEPPLEPGAVGTPQKPVILPRMLHGSQVVFAGFTPDAKQAVVAAGDTAVRLWDAASGRLVRVFHHPEKIEAAALSPDGKTLLTLTDEALRLWELASGREMRRVPLTAGQAMLDATFSSDGLHIAACGSEVRIWETATGNEVFSLRVEGRKIALHKFGTFVVSDGSNAHLYSCRTEEKVRTFVGKAGAIGIQAMQWDRTGTKLLATLWETAHVWDAATGNEIAKLEPGERITHASFTPDGKQLLTVASKNVGFFDLETKKVVRTIDDVKSCNAADLSRDGKRILLVSEQLWFDRSSVEFRPLDGKAAAVRVNAAAAAEVRTLAAAGNLLVIADRGHTRVFDIAAGKVLAELPSVESLSGPQGAALSPDAKTIALCVGESVDLYDFAGKRIRSFTGHKDTVRCAAFSPDGKRLAAGSTNKLARVWNTATGAEIAVLKGHAEWVNAITFSSDGKRVLTGGWDDTVRLWNTDTGSEIYAYLSDRGGRGAVAFSPQGDAVHGGGAVWDLASGNETRVYGSFWSVDHLHVGRQRVICADSVRLQAFDRKTGARIADIAPTAIKAVAFLADGSVALIGGTDGTLRLLNTAGGKELGRLHVFSADAWAFIDAEGNYDASPQGADGLDFVVGDKPAGTADFRRFHKPGLLKKTLDAASK